MQSNDLKRYYADKRVLITGADGFIGSRLTRELVEIGARVFGAVHTAGSPRLAGVKLETSVGDLSDFEVASSAFRASKPQIVFNTASTVNTTRDFNVLEEILQNTYGIARNVLSAAAAGGVERFIQFGSIDEYGFAGVPFKEDMHEQPFSPYSLGKTMGTHTALTFGRMTNMRVSVVRPAATYGPAKDGLLISNIIKSGLEKEDFDMNLGEQKRDLVYVDDLVVGVLSVGANEKAAGEIFNLGSNRAYGVRDVANMVNESMGNPITVNFGAKEYRIPDFMEFYMDSSKAEKVLGWKPAVGLEEGIKKTVHWFAENR